MSIQDKKESTCISDAEESNVKRSDIEDRYRHLFNSLGDAIFVHDMQGLIMDVNDYACRRYGYSHEKFKGMHIKEIETPEQVKHMKGRMQRLLKNGKVTFESVHQDSQNKYFPIEARVKFWEYEGKQVILAICHDISERKQAEEALMMAHKELERRVDERTMELASKNIALKEVLEQIEFEKKQVAKRITANVKQLLLPTIKRLRMNSSADNHKYFISLEKSLNSLTSTFGSKITRQEYGLSPREIELCNLIKEGFSSKEIAQLINISFGTVEVHRSNIRKKLNLSNKKINLSTFLKTI